MPIRAIIPCTVTGGEEQANKEEQEPEIKGADTKVLQVATAARCPEHEGGLFRLAWLSVNCKHLHLG